MTGVLRARVAGAWVDVVGSGSDEVVIGPDDPIATVPSTELWYDTDDDYSAGLAPTVVAGNALGIVAMGGFPGQVSIPATTNTQITNNLPYTLLVGRRYRISFLVRAAGIAAGTTPMTINLTLRDGATSIPDTTSVWVALQGNTSMYQFVSYSWVLDGDGVARTWNVIGYSGAATVIYSTNQSYFYIEDVGPNSAPALPVPTTYQSWTPVTFQNNWVNFDANGARAVQYRRVGDIVSLRGMMKGGTVAYSTAAFALPAGFRPPTGRDEDWTCRASGGVAAVSVFSGNGVISVVNLTSGADAAGYVYLNGVSFSVTG